MNLFNQNLLMLFFEGLLYKINVFYTVVKNCVWSNYFKNKNFSVYQKILNTIYGYLGTINKQQNKIIKLNEKKKLIN